MKQLKLVRTESGGGSYKFLKEEDLVLRQTQIASEFADTACISVSDAILLLRQWKWNPRELQELWFEDEDKIRIKCGVLHPLDLPLMPSTAKV